MGQGAGGGGEIPYFGNSAGGGRHRMVRAAAGGRATRACSCCVDGLLDDKVLMAGGATAASADSAVKSAELWDPATQAWTGLPDMAQKRFGTAASVLPSGRVAVAPTTRFGRTARCLTRCGKCGSRCRNGAQA